MRRARVVGFVAVAMFLVTAAPGQGAELTSSAQQEASPIEDDVKLSSPNEVAEVLDEEGLMGDVPPSGREDWVSDVERVLDADCSEAAAYVTCTKVDELPSIETVEEPLQLDADSDSGQLPLPETDPETLAVKTTSTSMVPSATAQGAAGVAPAPGAADAESSELSSTTSDLPDAIDVPDSDQESGGVAGGAAASPGSSTLTPVPLPGFCKAGELLATRTKICGIQTWSATLIRVGTRPTVLGTAGGSLSGYTYTSLTDIGVVSQGTILMTKKTGTFNPSVSGTFWCLGKCDLKKGSLARRALLVGVPVTGVGAVHPSLAAKTSGTSRVNWSFTVTHPKAAGSATPTVWSHQARCDNAAQKLTGKGCVIPAGRPTFTLSTSSTKHAEAAVHVKKALATGLRGSRESGVPLTRETSQTVIDKNRAKTCPSSLKRPSGHDCDEYPFASTKEGGASGGSARVVSGCHLTKVAGSGKVGFSRCMIDKNHNRSAGGSLSAFYQKQRLFNGDAFWVDVS